MAAIAKDVSSTAEEVAKVTQNVVVEAKDMSQLALGVVDYAVKVEESAKQILNEAETTGRNNDTVVLQVTTMAEGYRENEKRPSSHN